MPAARQAAGEAPKAGLGIPLYRRGDGHLAGELVRGRAQCAKGGGVEFKADGRHRSPGAGGFDLVLCVLLFVTLVNSRIVTTVAGGDDNAGNITLSEPVALTLVNGSRIQANAFEGMGGNVDIAADTLISDLPLAAAITASSERGVSGEISISSPDVDISAALVELSKAFQDPGSRLRDPCGLYRRTASGTFRVAGLGGLPAEPSGPPPAWFGRTLDGRRGPPGRRPQRVGNQP